MHKDPRNFTDGQIFDPSRWYNPDANGNVKESDSLVDGHWTFGYVFYAVVLPDPFRVALVLDEDSARPITWQSKLFGRQLRRFCGRLTSGTPRIPSPDS